MRLRLNSSFEKRKENLKKINLEEDYNTEKTTTEDNLSCRDSIKKIKKGSVRNVVKNWEERRQPQGEVKSPNVKIQKIRVPQRKLQTLQQRKLMENYLQTPSVGKDLQQQLQIFNPLL